MLLNPALHSRSVDPIIDRFQIKASKVFLALGLYDDVIDPSTTLEWLRNHDRLDWNPNNIKAAGYGHRTSVEDFINIWFHFEKNINEANELQKRYAV